MSTLDAICRFVLVVLANVAWQAAVIGILALLGLRLGRIRSPQWRSGICTAALLAISACPALTAMGEWTGMRLAVVTWPAATSVAPLPVAKALPVSTATVTDPPLAPASQPISPAPLERPIQTAPKASTATWTAIAAAWTRLTLPHALVAAYALGAAVLLLRLAGGGAYLLHLRRAASPAPDRWDAMLQHLAQQAPLRQRVRIRLSTKVSTPVLTGAWQPTILMPADLVDLPDARLEAILLHEIAHVRRHDVSMNVLQRLTEAVLFFHPAVWLLGRQLRLQRERCCDGWAIEQTGRDLDYAHCLMDLAERLTSSRRALPAVAMAEFRHELPRRVAAVLDGSARRGRSLPRWARCVMLTLALPVACTISACGVSDGRLRGVPPWQEETHTAVVKVVDEQGQPLPGVTIEWMDLRAKPDPKSPYLQDRPWPREELTTTTGPDGTATVSRYEYKAGTSGTRVTSYSIRAVHPDYCPAYIDLENLDKGQPAVLKKGATVRLRGYIGSPDRPVEGAEPRVETHLGEMAWQDLGAGTWQCSQIPAGKHFAWLFYDPPQGRRLLSAPALLDVQPGKEYSLDRELKPMARVEGRLDTSIPRPIRNGYVKVVPAPIEDPDPEVRKASSDFAWTWVCEMPIAKDGTFVLEEPAGRLQVIARCDGYLSTSPDPTSSEGPVTPQVFEIRGETAPIEVRMAPTAACQVRVVDQQGTPVKGAEIAFYPKTQWLGREPRAMEASLATGKDVRQPAFGISADGWQWTPLRASTGRDGVAVVRNLPGRKVALHLHHETYTLPRAQAAPTPYFDSCGDRYTWVDLSPGKTSAVTLTVQPKRVSAPSRATSQPAP